MMNNLTNTVANNLSINSTNANQNAAGTAAASSTQSTPFILSNIKLNQIVSSVSSPSTICLSPSSSNVLSSNNQVTTSSYGGFGK